MNTDKSFINTMPWTNVQVRNGAFPLDKYSIFNSFDELSSYAKTSPLAYEGQIVATSNNGKQEVYVLDSADDVNSIGLRRVGIISANELCGMSELSTELKNLISAKIWIHDQIDQTLSGESSNLSIIKICKNNFDDIIGSLDENPSELCSNTLFVVDSDYFDAYGQAISNVIMSADNIPDSARGPSEATNKTYVDYNICCLTSELCSVSSIINDKIENKSNIFLSSVNTDSQISGGKLDKFNIVKFDCLSTYELCSELITLSDLVLIDEPWLNAENDRIISVANPIEDTDAVNLQSLNSKTKALLTSIISSQVINDFYTTLYTKTIEGGEIDQTDIINAVSSLYNLIKNIKDL